MFQAVREAFGFGKTADPMQAKTQVDPRTEDALDKVARKFKNQADLWKRVASNTDRLRLEAVAERDAARAELARLKASRERSNANLRRGSTKRQSDAANERLQRECEAVAFHA